MEKIDRRRRYIAVIDTETANTLEDALVYDCGWAIVDKRGTVYLTRSFVNRDIFVYHRDLMKTAYYAEKVPLYVEELREGKRKMADWDTICRIFHSDCAKFGVTACCAHNARFDLNALNTSQRYITKSQRRYFFPYGVEIWDTMKMAEDVIATMPTFQIWAKNNGYVTKTGRVQVKAEVLYKFISNNNDFVESHTGLEDVLIEKEILAYCFKKHKAMRKSPFEKKKKRA